MWNFYSKIIKIVYFSRFVVVLIFSLIISLQPTVLALTTAERENLYRPFYDKDSALCGSSASTLVGTDNISKIYNYFVGKGLKDYQAAGILGNFRHESGYNPRRVQNTLTPSGDRDTPPPGDIGYGVAQFTPGSKILPYATETSRQPSDLTLQLDFIWKQFNEGEKNAFNALTASTDVASATLAFETKYERHRGPPQSDRIVEAERILALVQGGGLQSTAPSSPTIATDKPIIVLDPGHGGTTIDRDDPETGLHDGDYDNPAEKASVFAVAQMAKNQLEQVGYQVVLTKENVQDSVFQRDRANIANNAKATMAVSIHTQGDKPFGTWQEIYVQKVGLFRGTGTEKQTFTDSATAGKSQQYATVMKQERDAIEVTSGTTVIKDNNFAGRAPIEPGNIPLVQLWSKVPWIYLEAGGNDTTTGLTDSQRATYAKAIVSGIEKAVPVTGSRSSACNSVGGLPETILAYAWPEYHHAPFVTKKPEYNKAIESAIARHQYVGGGTYPGVDCGGFITRAMIDSGYEPNYNYAGNPSSGASNVSQGQSPWLIANWQLIGTVSSTSQLQPGDVAIKKDLSHTFMYVGKISGFSSTVASASLDERSPMSSGDDVTASNLIWYRKK